MRPLGGRFSGDVEKANAQVLMQTQELWGLDAHGWMQVSIKGTWVEVLTNLPAWRSMVSTTPPFLSQLLMASADGSYGLAHVASTMCFYCWSWFLWNGLIMSLTFRLRL